MKGLMLTTEEQTRLHIMNEVLEGGWSMAEAAQLLGVSERHGWRLLAAYREKGAAALAHGNRNRPPPNVTSPALRAQVITLARERYQGVNHTHLTELLADRERVTLSRSTVRRLLVGAGMPSPRHRRPPCHRCRRQRMPQEGMLLQIDGSHHRWLEERGPWFTLLLAVDDATGSVPYALFQEEEDTEGYFRLVRGVIERRGIPLALYSDRHIVFRHPSPANETAETPPANHGPLTQFGRAIRELGVTHIFARSPEAKGRVERANGTFQDRLVAELRLAGVSSIAEANHVLEAFLPRFNERFGVPAAQPGSAYRQDPGLDVETVLCVKERRKVAKDNTLRYHGKTLQLFPDAERASYARTRVEVQERLDGHLLVSYRGKLLTPVEAPPLAAELRAHAEAFLMAPPDLYPPEPIPEEHTAKSKSHTSLGWEGEWYEDETKKRMHRDLVRAGMARARQRGIHIGRPKVTERPEFAQRFAAVVARIGPAGLSRRQAARELAIGYATLKRLLDAQPKPPCPSASIPSSPVTEDLCNVSIEYAEVVLT
jgi:transposase